MTPSSARDVYDIDGVPRVTNSLTETVGGDFTPHAKQLEFLLSSARFCTVFGGRRSGKTAAAHLKCAVKIMTELGQDLAAGKVQVDYATTIQMRSPRRRYWIVAPSYELTLEPQRYIFRFLPKSEIAKIRLDDGRAKWVSQEKRLLLDGGIELQFRSAEDPVKLVGVSLDGLVLTEGAKLKSETWENLAPTLVERSGWLIGESTPYADWFYRELWLRGIKSSDTYNPMYASFRFSMGDNPTITPDAIALLRKQLPPHVAAREIEGDPEVMEGQIFTMFSHAHVLTSGDRSVRRFKRIVVGVDFGHASPGCALVLGMRGDDTVTVLDEVYVASRPPDAWIETYKQLRQKWSVRVFYVDPSASWLIDDMQRAGLPALGANNDRYRGVSLLMTLLHQSRLTIWHGCVNLIRELKMLKRAEGRHGVMKEEIAPGQDDHAFDALKYSLTEMHGPAVWGIG